MVYIYQRGKRRRRMHLQEHSKAGIGLVWSHDGSMVPLCRRKGLGLDTSINVPLGRRICKDCRKVAEL